MKKIIFSILLLSTGSSFAQDYYHGIGGAGHMLYLKESYTNENGSGSYSGISGVPLIVYKATLGFDISRKSNFGISAYPGAGFFVNTQTGGYAGFQLPIVGEYYMGDIDDACFYFGGGFDVNGTFTSGSTGGIVMGPHVDLGGQFEFRDQLIGLRLGYTYGINKPKTPIGVTDYKATKMTINIGAYYVIGQ